MSEKRQPFYQKEYESFSNTPNGMMIDIFPQPKNYTYMISKKMTDAAFASIGILLLLPVFVLIYLLIKWETPKSPIIYKQIRVGKYGKRFCMYKFRSMVTNADELYEHIKNENEIHGKMFKIKSDPRITKAGRWLRQTSLDELPQLWNVLKGDMSLVGPRPPLEREVAEYSERDFHRLTVVPGCTGLWQISGRNEVGFQEMLQLDFQYIERASWWLDIQIMIKTVPQMLLKKGAY